MKVYCTNCGLYEKPEWHAITSEYLENNPRGLDQMTCCKCHHNGTLVVQQFLQLRLSFMEEEACQ